MGVVFVWKLSKASGDRFWRVMIIALHHIHRISADIYISLNLNNSQEKAFSVCFSFVASHCTSVLRL